LPILLSDAAGVTSGSFDLLFDPALLSVEGILSAASLPADWVVSFSLSAPGVAHVILSGETPLAEGPIELVRLDASVPVGATAGAAQALRLGEVELNGGELSAASDAGVQLVEMFGDTTGDGSYSAMDASLIARVVVGFDGGFDAAAAIDPRLLADVTGDGTLSGLDASFVARKAVGLEQPEIPDAPLTPAGGPPAEPIPAIQVRVGGAIARPGGAVHIPVQVDATGGLLAADLSFLFDPRIVSLSDAQIVARSLPEGWVLVKKISADTGEVSVVLFGATPMAGAGLDLMTIDAAVTPTAPADAVSDVSVSGRLNEGRIEMTSVAGVVTVDGISPQVFSTSYISEENPIGRTLTVQFSEDVGASLTGSAIVLKNLTTGETLDSSLFGVRYDATNNTAVFDVGMLSDGNWRATIAGSAIVDRAGNAVGGGENYTFDFFRLAGDANLDRSVSFEDLVALAQNYEQPGRTWLQGDFDGDGSVSFSDLVALAQRYGTSLSASGGVAVAIAPVSAAVTASPTRRIFSTKRVNVLRGRGRAPSGTRP
jgi:hypothetical protein